MSILDISNWTIDEINNSIDTFKDTSLTDIGMVNCDIDSINVVGEVATATLWINEDVGIDGYTGIAPLKVYKEDKIEIKLNSPLLEGDTIEVVDGKLCHYHKMDMVALDGSENEAYQTYPELNEWLGSGNCTHFFVDAPGAKFNHDVICDNFNSIPYATGNPREGVMVGGSPHVHFSISKSKLLTIDTNGFKQWLQANSTTVVYELSEPYYEDITLYQSSIVLKTFNESSMTINTNLPIKANVSYRTNVPSISTLSNRVTEVSESDSVIQNLIDIIDDEVDE